MESCKIEWLPRVIGFYSQKQGDIEHFALVMEYAGDEVEPSQKLGDKDM